MSEIIQHADSTELKILIVFDINLDNSQKLCSKILQNNEVYECIIVCDDLLGGIGIIIILFISPSSSYIYQTREHSFTI